MAISPWSATIGDTVLVVQRRDLQSSRSCGASWKRWATVSDSHCDTEMVLRAFLEWDVRCISRNCAACSRAALWTRVGRRLVLVRDRMGIKPLYYRQQRRRLVLRLGDEGDSAASGARPADESARAGALSFAQLCSGDGHAGGGHREACARESGWSGRTARCRFSLTGGCSSSPSRGWIWRRAKEELDGCCVPRLREHLISDAPLGVWSSGGLGFFDHSALCGGGVGGAAENVFGFLSRAQF